MRLFRAVGGRGLATGGRPIETDVRFDRPPVQGVVKVPDRDADRRPAVAARFLEVGGEKEYVRGVTYGTFADGADGSPYPDPHIVSRDFAAMAAAGVNSVRLYTAPPRWLLDLAHEHGLTAMVGLAWEQHVAFLDGRRTAKRIVEQVERDAEMYAGHPAVLCYAVGNEIPASIVRWHGSHKIERFIERLYSTVKRVDPGALVTYVNYPSTEYLQLPFLDLVCFNVYLESDEPLQAYLARLHNIAGDRPLLLTEIGLDSNGHGADVQARVLEQQLRAAYVSGCAGAFVFSWTDEWHRGGVDVDDWHFGLVDRERRPKPALAAAERAFGDVPFARDTDSPRVSVVVCSYNGEPTISRCLEALGRARLPGLRGDRRRRRLDRPHRGDRRRVRRPPDHDREPRPVRRPQHRARGGHGRDRRLHRRRRLARPRLARVSSPMPSSRPTTPASAGRTFSPDDAGPDRERGRPRAGRTDPRAALRRASPSTSQGATWLSAERRWRRSAASTRSSRSPATTSTSAGACRSRAGRSASVRRRSSCTGGGAPFARYLRQQVEYGQAEALLERKWPDEVQPAAAISPGRGGCTPPRPVAGAAAGSATGPGAATSSSHSTTARRARSGRCR